ncbi:shikimate kinase [Candidatus Bathyarchaeota archaeon]|nr:MAG: shikimate kinase [Candidatus Bathyarchaeota archaeon]
MAVGEAIAYGAVTVVNALATGKGAALSVKLWTRAKVRLTDKPGIVEGVILSDPREDKTLMKKCVLRVLKRFGLEKSYGAYVETESNIPIARGLKSSSVASNAIVLATLNALDECLPDMEVLRLGVEASFDARVTVTGALDDASASYLGGVTVTDNRVFKILKRFEIDEQLRVIISVPEFKRYTVKMDLTRLKLMADGLDSAFREALEGKWQTAMKLNGIVCASALRYEVEPIFKALELGAVASGLSGKGPAIAAVAYEDAIPRIREVWKTLGGMIIETSVNNEKAHMLR